MTQLADVLEIRIGPLRGQVFAVSSIILPATVACGSAGNPSDQSASSCLVQRGPFGVVGPSVVPWINLAGGLRPGDIGIVAIQRIEAEQGCLGIIQMLQIGRLELDFLEVKVLLVSGGHRAAQGTGGAASSCGDGGQKKA